MKLFAFLSSSARRRLPPPRRRASSPRRGAGRRWRGERQCDAASLSLLPASKTRLQGRASLTFDRARPPRPVRRRAVEAGAANGASVMLTIDDEPSCSSRAGLARGAAGRRRKRRSSPRCAARRGCGSRGDRCAACASSTATTSPARRPRSTPPPPAPRRCSQATGERGSFDYRARFHERRHQPDADSRPRRPRARQARGGRARRWPGRAGRHGQGADPRRARGRRARGQAGQAARQADLALDLSPRGRRLRGDDRHRQGAALLAGGAFRHHPARSRRGAGLDRRHAQVAAAHPRRPRL